MKKNILYTLVSSLTLALFLTACGTDNKVNSNSSPVSAAGATASIGCFYHPDEESGPIKFQYDCYVHTVDGNSDPINGLTYDVSVVTNVKTSSEGSGTILTTDPITFSVTNKTFIEDNVQPSDTLLIFPTADRNDVSYQGNWQITSVNSNQNVTLKEKALNLETTDSLKYIIGNETRVNVGYTEDIGATAHIIYPEDGNTTLNVSSDEGLFYFTLVFDYFLEDHMVYLGAHTKDYRIGTARALFLNVVEDEEEPTP
jgi:hypothetical protein